MGDVAERVDVLEVSLDLLADLIDAEVGLVLGQIGGSLLEVLLQVFQILDQTLLCG